MVNLILHKEIAIIAPRPNVLLLSASVVRTAALADLRNLLEQAVMQWGEPLIRPVFEDVLLHKGELF